MISHQILYFNLCDLYRCKCGKCSMGHIQDWQECLCCTRLEGCMQSLESEEVNADLEVDAHCITEHPGFADVCLRN